jgi:hypothetical protein
LDELTVVCKKYYRIEKQCPDCQLISWRYGPLGPCRSTAIGSRVTDSRGFEDNTLVEHCQYFTRGRTTYRGYGLDLGLFTRFCEVLSIQGLSLDYGYTISDFIASRVEGHPPDRPCVTSVTQTAAARCTSSQQFLVARQLL